MTDDHSILANPERLTEIAIRAFARAVREAIEENDRLGVPSYGGKDGKIVVRHPERGRAMTDAEFEKLDAEFQRLLRSRRRTPPDMLRSLASCRDCDRPDPEFYMLKRSLWLAAVPTGRGCLCLACLAKRLGRSLRCEDFSETPDD
jgi:hypothetical protein